MKRLMLAAAVMAAGLLTFTPEADAQSGSRLYRQGVEAQRAQDFPRALQLYEQACDRDSSAGCFNLAHMLANGQGGPADDVRARQFFQRACDAGLPNGCSSLGFMLDVGRGGAADQPRARALYQRACDAGLQDGCANIGAMLAEALGGPPDHAQARTLLQGACNADIQRACTTLSRLNAGEFNQRAEAAAAAAHTDAWAAYNAERYRDARRLMPVVAEAGDSEAQYALGYMHTFGLGGGRDYLQAGDWLTRAAEQGHTAAQQLLIQIAPNVSQAMFIAHIDRYGPDTSSLQAFSNDVFDYCALRGPNCSTLQAQRRQMENAHNRNAEAANMARIWGLYGAGRNEADFWREARSRTECLRRVRRSIEAQTRGQQSWRYVNDC